MSESLVPTGGELVQEDTYGAAMTAKGLQLIAKIIASKANLILVQVLIGSGTPPKGIYIGDLECLVEPVAAGTVSEPIYKGSTVEMTVEYRSDMNGGLQEGFIIREFGIFAEDPDTHEAVMIVYGNLSKYPQYIAPYTGGGLDIRRYPVSITVAEGTTVILEGLPSVVMTLDDIKDYCVTTLLPQLLTSARSQIVDHNLSPDAHPDIRRAIEAAQKTADAALTAAESTPGGCALHITFAEGCAGQEYTVSGNGEKYTGIVPENLQVTVVVKLCNAVYTVTTQDAEGNPWTNTVVTGPYFGDNEASVSDFSATLTVTTVPDAYVTASAEGRRYSATADGGGTAALTIGQEGTYTVTAEKDGKYASGTVEISESGGSYSLTLDKFRDPPKTNSSGGGGGGGGYYRVFEKEEWTNNALRVPPEDHGMTPVRRACLHNLRQRVDRTALDYYGSSAALGRTSIINAVKAALSANASAPGTYPTSDTDDHPQLTWNQVQYYILEGVLTTDETAAAKAKEKGFDWQDRETVEAEQLKTLDEVLTSAYLPALNGGTTAFDALCTAEVLRGLRLRRKADGVGDVDTYDLDGEFTAAAWGVFGAAVSWDLETQELVISGEPFAGDILVYN